MSRLERWNGLHERKAPALVYDVVRASVHRERPKPPDECPVCGAKASGYLRTE